MKQPTAKVYRFRLHGHSWMIFIGPVRNKIEATQMLSSQFGDLLSEVRLHSAHETKARRESSMRRVDAEGGGHGHAA